MPKPGDFFLLAGTDAIGRLIDIGEFAYGDGPSKYTHAGILLGGTDILEAEPGGARVRPYTEYPAEQLTWSSWDLTDEQRAAIVAAARKYIGTPYSFLDYGALTAHRLHIPLPGLRQYIASTKHMVCSQLVDQSYVDAGQHMFSDGRWPGYVPPQEMGLVLTGPLPVAVGR